MFDVFADKKPKILLVDDEEMLLETLRERLEFNSLAVITAADGREGLDKALTYMPDIIITDIGMPVMNGLEMVKAIRGSDAGKDIPVVVISGNGMYEDRVEAMHLGAEYLAKPFEMSELLGKIEKLLEASSLRTSLT